MQVRPPRALEREIDGEALGTDHSGNTKYLAVGANEWPQLFQIIISAGKSPPNFARAGELDIFDPTSNAAPRFS